MKRDHLLLMMRTPARALLDARIANWSDLVDFEVVQVITSAEAAEPAALAEQ